jgi:hypothetical protein
MPTSITRTLQPNLLLNATIPATTTGPNDNSHWNLRYDGASAKMQFGEIPATLTGNDLVSLNRTVQGVQVDAVLAKGTLSGLVSQVTAPTYTDEIIGQNNAGPYYLSTSPVAAGSETVTRNGRQLVRERDYQLDAQVGALTLLRGQWLTPSDHLTVHYEGLVNGAVGGRIVALRGAYPISDHLTVGISHIGLTGHGASTAAAADEEDHFLGKSIAGPFYLTYRPVVNGSETLTINGVRQARNIAYTLDYATGQLRFLIGHIPPYGAAVDVRYRVAGQSAGSTDRSVTGIDLNWQSGKGLGFNLQTAVSGAATPTALAQTVAPVQNELLTINRGQALNQQVLHLQHVPIVPGSETVRALSQTLVRNQDYSLNAQSGELRLLHTAIPLSPVQPSLQVSYTPAASSTAATGNSAMIATATLNQGKVSAMARFRKTDPGFTPLDPVSSAVDRALEWSSSYAPNSALTLSTTGDNSRTPSTTVGAPGQTATLAQNRSYALNYHQSNLPAVTLQHTTHASSALLNGAPQGDKSTDDNLSTTWTKKAFTTTVSLDHSVASTRQPLMLDGSATPVGQATPANASSMYQSTTQSASVNVGYHPNDRLDLGLNLMRNHLVSSTDGVTSTTGGENLQVTATLHPKSNLALSANMQTNTTDAIKSSNGTTIPAQRNRNLSLQADWQPAKQLHVATALRADRTAGGDLGDNATATLSHAITWSPNDATSVSGYAAQQHGQFTQSAKSQASLVGLSAKITPLRHTTVSVDIQHLRGSNSDGVNQLWQTEGQARRAMPSLADSLGVSSPVNGTKLTGVSGSIGYKLGEKHDLSLTGELVGGAGSLGKFRRDAFGIGWHYHATDDLALSLDARRVRDHGVLAESTEPKAFTDLSASMTWTF